MIAQLFIALFGVTAVALSQSTLASRRRWASDFGLVGQPFWFYAAWDTQQWGIFALCILYTITWGKGFYSNWIATMAAPQAQPADALDWAVQRWNDEVCNRPMVNIHRRSLDDTWRQVITYLGGDAEKLIGPAHDDLLAAAQEGGA
ncbi:hypothetical protein ACFIQG_21010 [Comamonas odontotermitis]|uniref:hypothetical protein n=1 Tax=Comamonas odontotermitis TaxID=379895 RepID=UPI00366F4CB8